MSLVTYYKLLTSCQVMVGSNQSEKRQTSSKSDAFVNNKREKSDERKERRNENRGEKRIKKDKRPG